MKKGILILGILGMVLLAGCSTITSPSPEDTTTTADYYTNLDTEVMVSNDFSTAQDVRITISQAGGQPVIDRTLRLDPDENRDLNLSYPEPGTYTIEVNHQNRSATHQITIENRDPSFLIQVDISSEGIEFSRMVA